MLQSLEVRNFAIIDEVRLEFDPGLTVLTGETGAGKSILVGALQLLLGDRASSEQVRAGAEKANVQGAFTLAHPHPVERVLERLGVPLEDGVLIARREASAEGRSRAFLNDVQVTVGALREVGELLVDLHGQHEHQSLLHPPQHLLLLDAWAHLDELREGFGETLERLRGTREELEGVRSSLREDADRRELQQFQLREIEALDPRAGEMEELEREVRKLEGGERLATGLGSLLEVLSEGEGPVLDRLDALEETCRQLARIDVDLEKTGRLLSEARLALQESVHGAQRYLEELDLDQERLDEVRRRHSDLILLAKKHGGSMEALLARREELVDLLAQAERDQADLPRLEEEVERLHAEAAQRAVALSEARLAATSDLARRVTAELHSLAMPEAAFEISVERREEEGGMLRGSDGRRYEPGSTGIDRVEFRLRTNPGTAMLPLQRVASGGEVSRVMLALKSVFGAASSVPTLIFDEIDSGIGGRTADRVGEKLDALSVNHQVVVITHLPQIARRGKRHLVVEKVVRDNAARVTISSVEGEERTKALAVLMGGDEAPAVLEHARGLLGGAGGESTE